MEVLSLFIIIIIIIIHFPAFRPLLEMPFVTSCVSHSSLRLVSDVPFASPPFPAILLLDSDAL